MKARDIKGNEFPPNIAFVGDAGSGKTALASQVGDGAYVFDFDRGMRTALTLEDQFSKFRRSVEFDSYVDLNPAFPKCYSQAKQKLREMLANPPKALVIDSLTGLSQAVRLYTMHVTKHNAFALPEIQHWGMMVNEVEWFVLNARACNCLTILTAHTGLAEDSNGINHHIISSITKNHGKNKIAWLMDEVLYMAARAVGAGKFRYSVTGRSVDLPVRTRSGIVGDLNITDIGLEGLLKQMGYVYVPKASAENE